MKIKSVSLLGSVAVLFSILPLSANEALSGQGILATAKLAGVCGIVDSMIHFQTTTKMIGGDDFVARFWSVEATRLGFSVEQVCGLL